MVKGISRRVVVVESPDPRFFDRVFSDHPHLKRTRTMIVGDSLSGDMRVLEAVFSRSGFTDGYLTKKLGREMFGFRRKEDVTAANDVLPQLAALYRSERKSGTMDMHFQAHEGSPAVLEFTADGMSGRIEGRCPEAARNRSITCEDITKQLSKTDCDHTLRHTEAWLAKKYEDEDVVSFINGILGSFARSLTAPTAEATE